MSASSPPHYKDLPTEKSTGSKCSWGIFDEDGLKDEIGALNLLTPSVVLEAAKEIKTGKSVSLNWGLENMQKPIGNRCPLLHTIIDWRKTGHTIYCHDDEIKMNTQSGSQWDGLRHWGHVKTGMYYNGTHHDQLIESSHLGIDQWSKRGGLVGRAVLLDYCHWAQRNNISYSPMSNHSITIENLEAMAADQGVTFQTGDILIVRSGFVKWYNEHDDAERLESVTNGKAWIGVENTEKAVEWLWNKHFAAVAGDTVGFEVWPPVQKGFELHDHVLALLGMPIGELWDLEALAEECQKQNRWTFFFTSAPLNITGGIASPPNALAIF